MGLWLVLKLKVLFTFGTLLITQEFEEHPLNYIESKLFMVKGIIL